MPAREEERMHTVSAWFALACESSGRRRAARVSALACLLYALASCHAAVAQSAKPAAAPVTCATCHAGVVASYAHAPMRHALESPNANPVLDAHPKLSVQLGQYAYTV